MAILCVQDMMYQKNMLESISLKVELSMNLKMYNKGAVDLINSFSVGGHMQHINVKQCFLQELKEAKVLIVKWVPGSENKADLFTKKIDEPLFKCYAELLLGKKQLAARGVTLSKGGV